MRVLDALHHGTLAPPQDRLVTRATLEPDRFQNDGTPYLM